MTETRRAHHLIAGEATSPALISESETLTYAELRDACDERAAELSRTIPPGSVVAVHGEFTRAGIVDLLALLQSGQIVIPISTLSAPQAESMVAAGRAQFVVQHGGEPVGAGGGGSHPLYEHLRASGSAGLVLFSSGTTGRPKGTVHDVARLAAAIPRAPLHETVVAFLLYDHIGGINTLLQVLGGGGALAMPADRSPAAVAATVERARATVLPVSPSFLTLLLASGAAGTYDLSSLRTISYGSEVMPAPVLREVAERFPSVRLRQLYGMSEIGIIRTRSESRDSTWIELGGEDCDVRVVDGMLEIRNSAMMLGYLDDEAPFTDDGWLRTMDRVETRGKLFRVLGRASEMINVGGVKVLPHEVEEALLGLEEISDCVVFGHAHPLSGETVAAHVVPSPIAGDATSTEMRSLIRRSLAGSLDAYKIPTHVTLVAQSDLMSDRLKKTRGRR